MGGFLPTFLLSFGFYTYNFLGLYVQFRLYWQCADMVLFIGKR